MINGGILTVIGVVANFGIYFYGESQNIYELSTDVIARIQRCNAAIG
jgi:hypothetical protein